MTRSTTVPEVVSDGHAFLEGVRWHDGDAYASDFFAHRVLRWPGGIGEPQTVCEIPEQSSGLGWTPDGDLLVVSMTDRRLLRLHDGALTEVASIAGFATWHANDMVVDERGRAYIGNFGWDEATDPVIAPATLVRVDPDGTVTPVAEDMICPNGMAISPDGATLYVNETFAARVTAFDRLPDGSLTNRRVWASFTDQVFTTVPEALAAGVLLPDGMALDESGALWLADCHGDGITRVAEGGGVLEHVSTAPHTVFAATLGGPDRRTLFLACTFRYGDGDPSVEHRGTLRRIEVEVPGAGRP
ncbi:gluconolactonase [Nakamurella sp. YIM 132087]|uniref:Gluconolactonase n=1 Tax=Nakamurella alba TaxID=2665158 RepID=A0A7K1FSI9_9ACTN|nr:SMP-30/gluconolactonase/LRE family protein [Nakamurella alba]MTD17115.1 gluconolactonase [Nakamurella alba]